MARYRDLMQAAWITAQGIVLLGSLPTAAVAQQRIYGVVESRQVRAPLEGAMVVLQDDVGAVRGRTLTGPDGRFEFVVGRSSIYRLRLDRIGYASIASDTFSVPAGLAIEKRLVADIQPVELTGLDVEGSSRCRVRPEEGLATAQVWEEVRKALTAAAWTSERGMYGFTWMRYERRLDSEARRVVQDRRRTVRSFTSTPFKAIDPEVLASEGFVDRRAGDEWVYAAPDASVLLSDAFLATHCMRLDAVSRDSEGLLGLAFEPISGRKQPDVAGTLWINRTTAQLRTLDYRYVNVHPDLDDSQVGGTVTFLPLPNGTWIVSAWRIRMPIGGPERDPQMRLRGIRVFAYSEEGAWVQRVVAASGEVVLDVSSASLMGVVRDSLARPAADAIISVVGTELRSTTDDDGRFSLGGLGSGRWVIRVTTPSLQRVGYSRDVEIELEPEEGAAQVEVGLPSLREAASALCRDAPLGPAQAVLAGTVVDGAGGPRAGVDVQAWWSDYSLLAAPGGINTSIRGAESPARTLARGLRENRTGLATKSDSRGFFAYCGVPVYHTIGLTASEGPQTGTTSVWVDPMASVVATEIVLSPPPG